MSPRTPDPDPASAPALTLTLTADARGTKITWLSGASPASVESVNFVAGAALDEGAQVWNNYGPKPNEELLHGYGFVLAPNPDDTLGLKLGGAAAVPPAVAARLAADKLDMGQRFVVGADGELPQDLLKVVRILLGGGGCGHDHADDEDEHAAHQHEEEELELEADVLGMLGSMLEGKLAAIAEPDTEGCRPDVVRDCKVYRDGESRVRMKQISADAHRPEGDPAQGDRRRRRARRARRVPPRGGHGVPVRLLSKLRR